MRVEFFVAGTPVTQGNKTGFVRGGRVVIVEGRRGPSRKASKTWRTMVTEAARKAYPVPIVGAVRVVLHFVLQRPKTHLTKSGKLRKGKPLYPIAPRHDLDKLSRAVLDGLAEGGVIEDDGRVVDLIAAKRYGRPDDETGVQITITGLCDEHATEETTT